MQDCQKVITSKILASEIFQEETQQFIHIKKNFFACFFISGKGSSNLLFMDGKTRINGEVYCKILVFAKKEMDKLLLI